MEIQLQELIDKIKKDGIESASKEAARLKQEAEADAQRIVEEAKKEATDIVSRTKQDVERAERTGTAALEQASRNLILVFKTEIQKLLDKVIADTVASAFSIDVIKGILPDLIKNWTKNDTDSLTVLLSDNDLQKLDKAFMTKLSSTLKGGVEIRAEKGVNSGFRISEKDGSAYYDFSAEAVANMISDYLSPKLAETLKDAAKGM